MHGKHWKTSYPSRDAQQQFDIATPRTQIIDNTGDNDTEKDLCACMHASSFILTFANGARVRAGVPGFSFCDLRGMIETGSSVRDQIGSNIFNIKQFQEQQNSAECYRMFCSQFAH